ncbi:MAG: GNAT family N-acetyltransferase [Bacteroidaceae bacterium]|nr:GNAT family N-acetyltransferase [Bacteroidaceae bacterium]
MKHQKLELRQWALSDSKELMRLCNVIDRRFLSDRLPNPYTEKDAKEWLKMVSKNEASTGIYRAILCEGALVGSISVERKGNEAEIGYMLLNEYANKGIATEAVKQICPIAFKILSLERITANVFQPNIASIRVLQKNGFRHESTMQNAVIKDGIKYDLLVYGLTINNI